MLNNKFGNRWVGSDINCCSPCIVAVNESMSTVPSSDAMSSGHNDLHLILSLMTNLIKLTCKLKLIN